MGDETIGELLRRLRKERGLTQGQLATYAKVTRSWLSLVEAGYRMQPGREMLERVAVVLRVPPEMLLAAAGYRVVPLAPPERRSLGEIAAEMQARIEELERERQRVIMVPVVESIAAAGEGAVAEMEHIPYVPTPEELGHDFFAIKVRGDCMAPTIMDGDTIIIDRNAKPGLDDIVGVVHDGESLLRIFKGDRLESLNEHGPLLIDSRTHIQGVVVFTGRRPRL